MKKHIMLKPLSEEEMYRGIMGPQFSLSSISSYYEEETRRTVAYLKRKIHDLDFYFDEDTKEISGRDGEYVADIFNNKNNVFWYLYHNRYGFPVWLPTIELREGLLGALLRFAWDVDGGNMEWEVISEVPIIY